MSESLSNRKSFHFLLISSGLFGIALFLEGSFQILNTYFSISTAIFSHELTFSGIFIGGTILSYYILGRRFENISMHVLKDDMFTKEFLSLRKKQKNYQEAPT